MAGLSPVFDGHLHPQGLTDEDLETLAGFGLRCALVPCHPAPLPSTPKSLRAHFRDIIEVQLPRLERAGIRGYAALGIHPRSVPRRGLAEVLSSLPEHFRGGRVVALGELGLDTGSEAEVEAFTEQLALAKRLKLPALIHTPHEDKARLTKKTLGLLRTAGLSPTQVLVDHCNQDTVRTVLECGHYAGLTLQAGELSLEEALSVVRHCGSERLVLDSDAGEGAGDLLALPRVARRLLKAGLSERVLARVAWSNASDFLRLGLPRPKA